MTFRGWDRVGENLRKLEATATPRQLNEGQRASLRELALRVPQHGVVIADEVGMGKTRIAVALARAVKDAGGRVAILVPPTLGFQWQDELREGGVSAVPDVVRSFYVYLKAWSDIGPHKPWFDEQIVLISHGFVTWRLGATTRRWRFEILPFLAGLAQRSQNHAFPYGFRAMASRADLWVQSASYAIDNLCRASSEPSVKSRFTTLGSETTWREANEGANYEQGSPSRRHLQTAVGLGLGAFDLIIVDEAHKNRREDGGLSNLIEKTLLETTSARRLCLTATPVELSAEDWDRSLKRVGIDSESRARIKPIVEQYGNSARRVRLGWRSSAAARDTYVAAADAFEKALGPYVLRRSKRGDPAVALFSAAASSSDFTEAYRWEHDIRVRPTDLSLGWRQAVCAVEALSFAVHGREDTVAKRFRLTFANGHGFASDQGVATRLDVSMANSEDNVIQPGDPNPSERLASDVFKSAIEYTELSPDEDKRLRRAAWWHRVIDKTAKTQGAIYYHPAIIAAVAAIEDYDVERQKVLVFGRFTEPMRALVDLLNARAMLRALEKRIPWPQQQINKSEMNAARAAHQQLGRPGIFHAAAINEQLAKQYGSIERRRDSLRKSLFDLILTGLPEPEREARIIAQAARLGAAEHRALLARVIDQFLSQSEPVDEVADANGVEDVSIPYSAEEIAKAFLQLLSALRERGEGDANNDKTLDPAEAGALWSSLAERLKDEYNNGGRFARLMNGATALPTRRTLQIAFNRAESNPRVLVAQSLVGREGLNLHQACRVIILLHPEWNPAVVEQQVGRIDRVGSRWAKELQTALEKGAHPLPRIEIRPVIFEGTYDAHHWRVLLERWDDLRAYLHGTIVPHRLRQQCTDEEGAEIKRLDAAAPRFEPISKRA